MARQWRRRSEAAAAPPRAGDGGPTPVIGAASRRASGASAAGAVLVALALCARPGSAQTTLADVPEETPPEVEAPARRSLLGRFGLERQRALLDDPAPEVRLRGIARAGRIGTPAALTMLVAFAYENSQRLTLSEQVALVRALHGHVHHAPSRELLTALVMQPLGEPAPPREPRVALVQEGAALALAHTGDAAALRALGQVLRTEGAGAEAAFSALLAHPPSDLEPLLSAPGAPTPRLARWLGHTRDRRAEKALRAFVRSGDAPLRAAAAVALAELGVVEARELAASWLDSPSPTLRAAALEILVAARDARADAALAGALAREPLDERLASLTLAAPSRALEPALLERLRTPGAEGLAWPWTLLGRLGTESAARHLSDALTGPAAVYAAHALARASGDAGESALERALTRRETAALAARALAARAYERGETPRRLRERLGALMVAEDASQRAAGAWGLGLLEPETRRSALESGDEVRVLAVCRHAALFDAELAAHAATLLAKATSERTRVALGAALVHASARDAVSTRALLRYLETSPALAPLAARALAERADSSLLDVLRHHLEGADALLRAHVARGLGDSSAEEASGLLVAAYEREADADVRHAIVIALAARRGKRVRATLDLAAALDPSSDVRRVARSALDRKEAPSERSRDVLWTELASTKPGPAAPDVALLFTTSPGTAQPAFADPDGVLVLAGAPARGAAVHWR